MSHSLARGHRRQPGQLLGLAVLPTLVGEAVMCHRSFDKPAASVHRLAGIILTTGFGLADGRRLAGCPDEGAVIRPQHISVADLSHVSSAVGHGPLLGLITLRLNDLTLVTQIAAMSGVWKA